MNDTVTIKNGEYVSYDGPKAVDFFRVRMLHSSIGLYIKTDGQVIPTRGMGITKMLSMASQYTGKKYKLTQKQNALDDLALLIDQKRSELNIVSK